MRAIFTAVFRHAFYRRIFSPEVSEYLNCVAGSVHFTAQCTAAARPYSSSACSARGAGDLPPHCHSTASHQQTMRGTTSTYESNTHFIAVYMIVLYITWRWVESTAHLNTDLFRRCAVERIVVLDSDFDMPGFFTKLSVMQSWTERPQLWYKIVIFEYKMSKYSHGTCTSTYSTRVLEYGSPL